MDIMNLSIWIGLMLWELGFLWIWKFLIFKLHLILFMNYISARSSDFSLSYHNTVLQIERFLRLCTGGKNIFCDTLRNLSFSATLFLQNERSNDAGRSLVQELWSFQASKSCQTFLRNNKVALYEELIIGMLKTLRN